MGIHLLPLFTCLPTTPSPSPFSFPSAHPKTPNPPYHPLRISSIRSRPRAKPRYDSSAETFRSGRSKFSFDDELFTDDDEDDFGFGFGSSAKKRTWWSDEMAEIHDDDDDDDEEFWVFKVFKAFGWMLPAIVISMLLGTGPNALFMAIALPLGQSVFSLAIDKVWGRTDSPRPRPRSRTKKKPFTKAASNVRAEIRREENVPYGKERESPPSAETASYRSVDKGNKSSSSYGGWDELEKQKGAYKIPRSGPNPKTDGLPKKQGKGKLSRRGRNRDTPLLLRLLIAVFPFLGSWTRLLL